MGPKAKVLPAATATAKCQMLNAANFVYNKTNVNRHLTFTGRVSVCESMCEFACSVCVQHIDIKWGT